MTSKLKCPFCQQELKEIYCNGICVGLACKNVDCLETKSTLGNKALWQALIQAKEELKDCQHNYSVKSEQHERGYAYATKTIKDLESKLEIARKALEDIKSDYELYSEQGCRMEPNETDMYNYARKALEQIEHKEEK